MASHRSRTTYQSRATYRSKQSWAARLGRSLRQHPKFWVTITVGVLLLLASATAYAAIVLRGEGTVTAAAYQTAGLEVSGERLSNPLTPGGTADLVFVVRNPNTFPGRVDRVALASPLRKAQPAGCGAKVGGPVTTANGYALPAASQVVIPAGGRETVTVPAAFTLARSARTGCGFTVDIAVQATQLVAPTSEPTVGATPPAPPQSTVTVPTQQPTTSPPTTEVPPLIDTATDPADMPGEDDPAPPVFG